MHVVQMAQYRNRRVVAVARELLELAEAGGLHGQIFVAKLGPRDHRAGIVGDYEEHPEQAVFAAGRLNQRVLAEE
jgi:hypothetical protein